MRRALLTILAAILVFTVAASVLVANGALHIYSRPEPSSDSAKSVAGAAHATWEPAEVTAPDHTVLRAWIFTPPAPNGAAVILLHGVADTRAGVLHHATYLLSAGFTVLTPDARGHGISGGDVISYGVKEAADVHVWADWLFAHRPIARLYGMGESMGAGIILQSLTTEKRLRAVVAECPFATFDEVAFDRLAGRTAWPRATFWPVVRIGSLYARLILDVDLRRASPIDALRTSTIPVLLIHGTADTNIPPVHSKELLAANPVHTTLWLVPGATHTNALSTDPALYIHTVTAWFLDHK